MIAKCVKNWYQLLSTSINYYQLHLDYHPWKISKIDLDFTWPGIWQLRNIAVSVIFAWKSSRMSFTHISQDILRMTPQPSWQIGVLNIEPAHPAAPTSSKLDMGQPLVWAQLISQWYFPLLQICRELLVFFSATFPQHGDLAIFTWIRPSLDTVRWILGFWLHLLSV